MDSIQFLGKRPRAMDFSGLPAPVEGLCVSDTFDYLADVCAYNFYLLLHL